jgi:cytidylate kinase
MGGDRYPLHWYRAVLAQGWRRQLRRMFAAVEAPVERLVRVRVGTLRLDGLHAGEAREIPSRERDAMLRDARSAGPIPTRQPVVSLDGPGSSGKSSVGAGAAAQLGFGFCDTGLLYRALTWLALERNADPDDASTLVALVSEITLAPDERRRYSRVQVAGNDVTEQVHTRQVDRFVSQVARHPEVRGALLPVQRRIAEGGGMIMAGRDIGTVVLPDADVKLWLEVSLEERARRRAVERGVPLDDAAAAAIAEDLRRRDHTDSTRTAAPLRVPPGATIIETEGNTLEQTIAAVVRAIRVGAARQHGTS